METLRCPLCSQTVSFSYQLKDIIQSRYQRVQALSELFFAQQLKIAERKRILLSNCQNEESRIFSSIIKTLKETKVPISNTALFMLETKYELYRILEDSDCDELRNRIILNKTISYDVIRHICQLDSVTEDMRVQLNGLQIFSYEEGLWSWCSKCCDVFQTSCNECDE